MNNLIVSRQQSGLNITWIPRVVSVVLILLIGGCATMDESECQSADWYTIGVSDGGAGQPKTRGREYVSECGEYGIAVDSKEYLHGWEQAIRSYCTREGGWKTGINGQHYHRVCPSDLETAFFNAYQVGRGIFEKKTEVSSIRYELEEVIDDLESDALSKEQRGNLKKERKKLKNKLYSAEFDVAMAIREAGEHGFHAGY